MDYRMQRMKVIRIEEAAKARYKIFLENGFAFVLYKGELPMFHIKEDGDLSDEDYEKIMKQILPKRAKLRAMNLLKVRPYTEYQLRNKLNDGGYPAEIIDEAISYVKSFHYVDDIQYTKDYIAYHKESKSKTQLCNTLMSKGIPRSLITECYEELVGDEEELLEEEQIRRWIQKKKFTEKEASYEEIQRMTASLYRKGFSIQAIRRVLLLDITSNNV